MGMSTDATAGEDSSHEVADVADVAASDLSFPEGPRWRAERWWMSDQLGGRILTLDDAGAWSVAAVVDRPSGLGFAPDGTLWAATMEPPRVVASSSGSLEEVVDLADLATSLNDMVVDNVGRAYVDAYGERSEPGRLVLVTAGSGGRVVAEDLAFPNGLVVTPDGRTLLVAETFGERISAFSIGSDGSLAHRRV